MPNDRLTLPIGQRISLPGHFDVPVILEDARALGPDGSRVREQANDSKLAALHQCLQEAQFSDLKDGRGKLLLFTEHRDTLNYVRDHLERWGYSTCEIHGGMNPHERQRAQELFRTQSQVCVATEAAGEGINLQFCDLMINYDLPWNPTRLEQRLGRIQNPAAKLDHAKREIIAARFFEIPAEAIAELGRR